MRRFRLTPLRLAAAVLLGVVGCSSVAFAASLGVSSNKLYAWSQTLTKATCATASMPAYDTYVDQSAQSANNGSATTLAVGGVSTKQQYAFIRFDLSACNIPTTGGADSATLTLHVTNTGKDTISLYPVTSTWDPATLNWGNYTSLTIGSTATTTFTPNAAGTFNLTVTADVDAAIKAGTLWGWELVDTSGTKTTSIGAADNTTPALRPTLALSYEK